MKLSEVKNGKYFELPNGDVMMKGKDIVGENIRCYFMNPPVNGKTYSRTDGFLVNKNQEVRLLSRTK